MKLPVVKNLECFIHWCEQRLDGRERGLVEVNDIDVAILKAALAALQREVQS